MLASRGVGKTAHYQIEIISEAPVKVFCQGLCRGRKPDAERRCLGPVAVRIGKAQQYIGLLIAQPQEYGTQFIPSAHTASLSGLLYGRGPTRPGRGHCVIGVAPV
jgi:hypothetical protein